MLLQVSKKWTDVALSRGFEAVDGGGGGGGDDDVCETHFFTFEASPPPQGILDIKVDPGMCELDPAAAPRVPSSAA